MITKIKNNFHTAGILSEVKDKLFKNEIIIGKYRMQRETSADDWTVTEVAQMSSVKAWHPMFRLRWKGILRIAIEGGWNLYTVLRFELELATLIFYLVYLCIR